MISKRVIGKRGTPGLLVLPDDTELHPGVVLLHERYGLVAHTEDFAQRLAARGFAVAAPDLFHAFPNQDALHRGEAQVTPSDDEAIECLDDIVEVLGGETRADAGRLGLIGVCQTGRYAVAYGARRPLQSCVALYGAAQARDWVVNTKQPNGLEPLIAKLEAPVLALFGERDHVISIADIIRLRAALEQYDKSYELVVYPDAPHGWLNDTMPGRYRPEIAARTWEDLVGFLERTLAAGYDASKIEWRFSAAKSKDYDFAKNVRME